MLSAIKHILEGRNPKTDSLFNAVVIPAASVIFITIMLAVFVAFVIWLVMQLQKHSPLQIKSGKHSRQTLGDFIYGGCAYIICGICIVAILSLCRLLHLPWRELLKFLLFVLGYLVFPGYVFIRDIKAFKSFSALVSLSTLMGIGLLFTTYFISSCLHDFTLLYVASPVFAVLSLFFFGYDINKKHLSSECLKLDPGLLAITAVLVLYSFGVRAFLAVSPVYSGTISYFMDSVYIISNSASLTGGLFSDSINFPGFLLRYHCLSNVLQACAINVTGIAASDIYMSYWSFFYLPIITFSVHALAVEYRESKKGAVLCLLSTFFTSIFSFGIFYLFQPSDIKANLHMQTGSLAVYLLVFPNGIEIAIPALLATAFILMKIYKKQCGLLHGCFLIFVTIFIATGAKTPFGFCALGALVGTIIFMVFQKRPFKEISQSLLLLLTAFGAIILAYVILIHNTQAGNNTAFSLFHLAQPGSALRQELLTQRILNALDGTGIQLGTIAQNILCLLLIPLSLWSILPFAMPAFLIWVVQQLKNFGNITRERMFMCGVAVCGLIGYYSCVFDLAYSQLYFLFSALLFVQILGFYWIYDHYKSLKLVGKLICSLFLAFGLFFACCDPVFRILDAQQMNTRINNFMTEGTMPPEPAADYLNYYEYNAMRWLRDNTPKDAVIAVDRFFTVPVHSSAPEEQLKSIDHALYFYYGAYSERHLFLGGFSYSPRTPEMIGWLENQLAITSSFYAPDTENRAELMRENSVSYLVVSRFVQGDYSIQDPDLELVYNNRDVKIYGLK